MSAKKSYADMAKEAIVALKDRTGSSLQALKSYIVANNAGLNFAPVSFPLYSSFFFFSARFVYP